MRNIPFPTLKSALLSRGYRYREVTIHRRHYIEYKSPNGWIWLTKISSYDYPFVSVTAHTISKDKVLGNSFAEQFNVPSPPSLNTDDHLLAELFLIEHQKLIVKPISGSGSRGLTLNIETSRQLREAIQKVAKTGSSPLIQKQFDGEEVRLTIINGKVCSAILRQTPRVTGDGKHTVAELIEIENALRLTLQFPLLNYPQLDEKIIDFENIPLNKVISKGTIFELSRATMIRNGSSFYGILSDLHSSFFRVAEMLAQALNHPMLVVDFLIKDYKAEATQGNYIFLEFNTSPALGIYSSIRGGDKPDVIGMLADKLDRSSAYFVPLEAN